MRCLFDPIIRNYSDLITATNLTITYNPQNIKHPFLKKRVQGATTSMVITIPFSSDQTADCLFYGIHNLSSLSAVFKDSGGSTIDTIAPGTIYDIGVEYFTEISGIRSIELTINTVSSYVKLGGFECGNYYQMPDFVDSWPIEPIDNSISNISLGGQVSTDDIEKRRAYRFKHIEITKEIADELIANYNINGKRPLFIDLTENNRGFFSPIYARIEKPFILNKENRRFTMETEIQEAF